MQQRNIFAYFKPGHEFDPNEPDPTMAIRSRRSASIGPAIIVAVLATIIGPFGMQKMAITDFCFQMAMAMALGLVLAGLWGMIELLWPDPVTHEKREDRSSQMIWTGLAAGLMAVVLFLLAWLVATIGSGSWFSYDVLKSGGLVTYIIGGLLPVIGYTLVLYAVATRQIIINVKWRAAAIIGLVFSLLAPWFWAGYRLYLDYHVM